MLELNRTFRTPYFSKKLMSQKYNLGEFIFVKIKTVISKVCIYYVYKLLTIANCHYFSKYGVLNLIKIISELHIPRKI